MTNHSELFTPTDEYTSDDLRSMWDDIIARQRLRGRSDEEAEFTAECAIRGFTGRTTYHLIPEDQRFLKTDLGVYGFMQH